MRISVRKRYSRLEKFVGAANLGWEAIFKDNDFPTLENLEPQENTAGCSPGLSAPFAPDSVKSDQREMCRY